MKCKVCGAESGKYVLCQNCNKKREEGLIIKCEKCNNWHYKDKPCNINNNENNNNDHKNESNSDESKNKEDFLYSLKETLITDTEKEFFIAIKKVIPENYSVFPQINLAAFIEKTDNSRFRNELFRNVDFLITDEKYKPKIAIEINDQTHLNSDRRERDEKVKNICEEAGIPIINLWTSYGVNTEYIKERINKTLSLLPVERKHHFQSNKSENNESEKDNNKTNQNKQTTSGGCYIATCVYGSYNSPEVMILRKYRDNKLSKTISGRAFIKIYYKLSPILVKCFGKNKWFKIFWRKRLDKIIKNILKK